MERASHHHVDEEDGVEHEIGDGELHLGAAGAPGVGTARSGRTARSEGRRAAGGLRSVSAISTQSP